MAQTYYEVLGIEPGAKQKEVKAAFRLLAKRYHPDTNRGDPAGEKRLETILKAYRFLSSPEKRALYDAYLARRVSSARRVESPPEPRPHIVHRLRAFLRDLLRNLRSPEGPAPPGRRAWKRPARKVKRAGGRSPAPSFEEALGAAERENRSVYQMCDDGVIRKAAGAKASARQAACHPGMRRRYGPVGVLIFFLSAWWETLTR